jgi:hypothetical protein
LSKLPEPLLHRSSVRMASTSAAQQTIHPARRGIIERR